MRVLIVGCGYVGLPLGARLAGEGHEVHGLRRSADLASELRAAGVIPCVADITSRAAIGALPGKFDWIVNTVSSTRGGPEEYQRVYWQGTQNLLERFGGEGLRKYVYTGSTSVYGQTDGSAVTESDATEPTSATSRVLVEVEELLLREAAAHGFPAVVLRVAGIYGPGRGHLFLRYLAGEARLHGNGDRLINMIHRDDVVGGILRALELGEPGLVYNLVDDLPVSQREFFQWLSSLLRRPMPPAATAEENAQRKRGLTQKKVINAKAKRELGWNPIYPTFREGYSAEIERMRSEGLI